MAWIVKSGGLSVKEMNNNANIVINYYRARGWHDHSIAGLLGNMQNESSVNPGRVEAGGGGGFGLVQWTPKTVLIKHASTLGLSPYTSGNVQLEVIEKECLGTPGSVNEWYSTYAFVEKFFGSGATQDMVGISGSQFIKNNMNWTPYKLAILFMTCYERPSYDPATNHWEKRANDANKWLEYMGGEVPPTDPSDPIFRRNKMPLYFYLRQF